MPPSVTVWWCATAMIDELTCTFDIVTRRGRVKYT